MFGLGDGQMNSSFPECLAWKQTVFQLWSTVFLLFAGHIWRSAISRSQSQSGVSSQPLCFSFVDTQFVWIAAGFWATALLIVRLWRASCLADLYHFVPVSYLVCFFFCFRILVKTFQIRNCCHMSRAKSIDWAGQMLSAFAMLIRLFPGTGTVIEFDTRHWGAKTSIRHLQNIWHAPQCTVYWCLFEEFTRPSLVGCVAKWCLGALGVATTLPTRAVDRSRFQNPRGSKGAEATILLCNNCTIVPNFIHSWHSGTVDN